VFFGQGADEGGDCCRTASNDPALAETANPLIALVNLLGPSLGFVYTRAAYAEETWIQWID